MEKLPFTGIQKNKEEYLQHRNIQPLKKYIIASFL